MILRKFFSCGSHLLYTQDLVYLLVLHVCRFTCTIEELQALPANPTDHCENCQLVPVPTPGASNDIKVFVPTSMALALYYPPSDVAAEVSEVLSAALVPVAAVNVVLPVCPLAPKSNGLVPVPTACGTCLAFPVALNASSAAPVVDIALMVATAGTFLESSKDHGLDGSLDDVSYPLVLLGSVSEGHDDQNFE